MILVDSSVWIDHLRRSEAGLIHLLLADEVCVHPLIVEEIALGSIAHRDDVLAMLEGLHSVPVVAHDQVMTLIEDRDLWSKGLSAVDAHLLCGAVHAPGDVKLWTRDKRLAAAAADLDIAHSG